MRLLTIITTIATLALLLVACDEFPSLNQIGTTVDEQGDVVVIYRPCDEERIERVAIERASSENDAGARLWEIVASPGAPPPATVVIGEIPQGFQLTQALGRSLAQEGGQLNAVVESSVRGEMLVTFSVNELSLDSVAGPGGKDRSMAEFDEQAADACG